MRGQAMVDDDLVEHLWPVTEDTVGKWRSLMNERMAGIDHAVTLEKTSEQEILTSGGAYFVHRDGEALGAFWLREDEISLIASLMPGAGQRVLHTLFSLVPNRTLRLQVVSTNAKAIRFYEKMGFLMTGEAHRWYRVLP